jgi:endonuclease G
MLRTLSLAALALAAVLSCRPALAAPQADCSAFVPFGAPALADAMAVPPTPLCRRGYLVAHDDARKQPLWVAEALDATSAWGCGERSDGFVADPDLPKQRRSVPADYLRSGYDMGHMASAANHLTDPLAQRETFFLSNMAPQLHSLNAGLWFKLEVMGRVWASQRGPIQILSGPVQQVGQPTIGRGEVPVPVAFWKVFVDLRTRETLAFLLPHAVLGWREDPARYVVSLSVIEATTGLTLPRPGGSILLEPTAPWPIDLLQADNLRARACPVYSAPSLPPSQPGP